MTKVAVLTEIFDAFDAIETKGLGITLRFYTVFTIQPYLVI